ncbi:uncharacterized protein [Nicotiana tomentosiformis]|uniref:uncharacterized protein n=1 Tax=Nicotiana tomentosiformis TaxID=4098 RepID=UPI00388C4A77
MQGVVDKLVDYSQAAFVPGRVITDNIILSHELVKGYNRKSISPRCMLQIDMQKAHDSVEWAFIEQLLSRLQFSTKFIKWVTVFILPKKIYKQIVQLAGSSFGLEKQKALTKLSFLGILYANQSQQVVKISVI